MIKACLFDLDGVIVDTAKYHYLAWKELASSLGIEFNEEHNENLKGVGRMESLDYILELGAVQKTDDEKARLAHEKNERYKVLVSSLDAQGILPGVKAFLEELRGQGIGIGLGSSSKNARPVLDYLGLKSYFDVIIDGTDIRNSKPDPEVFILGASALDLDPSEIVVFEDAQAGIEAAIRGGFMSVGVGSEDELSAADFVISGFDGFSFEMLKNQLER